jgi:hypothetical protein
MQPTLSDLASKELQEESHYLTPGSLSVPAIGQTQPEAWVRKPMDVVRLLDRTGQRMESKSGGTDIPEPSKIFFHLHAQSPAKLSKKRQVYDK